MRENSHSLHKIVLLLGVLSAANIAVWLLTWRESHTYAMLLSSGLLAYGFGLRHAVDADHISAIDNTTRKLMQQGQRPTSVGLFFSLGHSTVVVLLCAALALSSAFVEKHLPQWRSVGAIVGTVVSGAFLYLIGFINLIVLLDLFKAYRRVAGEHDCSDTDLDSFLARRGLLGRIFRTLFRMVRASWQMYWIGLLFGLGFDTATEVGILAVSARSGQTGIPIWAIMLLPALFTVGMCLVDTLDGILMLGAYGWATVKPLRKLYYNLCITLLSVSVAFVVGSYELLQIVQAQLGLHGAFWATISGLSFNSLGFFIIALFLVGWGMSALIYKWKNYEVA